MEVKNCGQPTLGLTTEEQWNVTAAAARLPCGWQIALETIDDAQTYARIVPPWNPDTSAFLIDREHYGVVLTDNITKNDRVTIRVMDDVDTAIEHIATVVSGGTRPKQPLRAA
jgi:hypothetical protein